MLLMMGFSATSTTCKMMVLNCILVALALTQIQAALPSLNTERVKDKLSGANDTEKESVLSNAFSKSKEFVVSKLNDTLIPTDAGDEGPIDSKYFDDISRIINHLDFEKATPRAVKEEEVAYYLFTRENRSNNTRIYPRKVPKNLKNKRKVVFIVHGWRSDRETQWVQEITDGILNGNEDVAVIQVDWRSPAGDLYAIAVLNVRDVGSILGEFIVDLNKNTGVSLENINVIGHSLGAHVSGFAGKKVQNETGRPVAKIFGLDPAGPLFSGKEEQDRLSKDDAREVFVLHTDGGKFGYRESFGAADFFANGGTAIQPGCLDVDQLSIKNITSALFCSHARAPRYFIEMIKDPNLAGVQCDSFIKYKTGICDSNQLLSFFRDRRGSRGDFYFTTDSKEPYTKSARRLN